MQPAKSAQFTHIRHKSHPCFALCKPGEHTTEASFATPTTCPACILLAEKTPECVVAGHAIAAGESDRVVAARSGASSFLDTVCDANEKARALRDSLVAMIDAVPTGTTARITAMADPEVAKGIGSVVLLCAKNAAWIGNIVQRIAGAFGGNSALLETFTAAYGDGQVDVEMSCPCGACDACEARAALGDEKARENIGKVLRPTQRRIVMARG